MGMGISSPLGCSWLSLFELLHSHSASCILRCSNITFIELKKMDVLQLCGCRSWCEDIVFEQKQMDEVFRGPVP